MSKDDDFKRDADDEVGYRKPPRHSRFKPGQSGNPRGRSSGKRNLATDVRQVLAERVPVKENGKVKKRTVQDVALRRLMEKALNGDLKALEALLRLAAMHNNGEKNLETGVKMSADDEDVIAAFRKNVLEADGKNSFDEDPSDTEK